ncbi:hypothetical protein JCM17960_33860 [Magnetospira thiophila]
MVPVIVHHLHHCRMAATAAQAAGRALLLCSPPNAGANIGAAVFHHMAQITAEEFPELSLHALLDCGDAPGLALNALRQGVTLIHLQTAPEVFEKVRQMAEAQEARLLSSWPEALDLGAPDFRPNALSEWLRDAADFCL